jgi:glyoxylase-like metal-dependent hydrolase (beta-lactamase superfamily II)
VTQTSALFRLIAAYAAMLSLSIAGFAAAPQHREEAPGYFRVKVGALEVTSLFDGAGAFQTDWLKGPPEEIGKIGEAVKADPHFLDGNENAFLVNTGTKLILVDAGAGAWFGGGAFGRVGKSLREAGYSPGQVDLVLVTHLHSDHVGGLTSKKGERLFPSAHIYVAKSENDFWLSREIAAKAPAQAKQFFDDAQAIARPYIQAGRWHTFEPTDRIVDGLTIVPLPGHTPGHSGFQFESQGQKILFWGDTVHSLDTQLPYPDIAVVFDGDPDAAAASRAKEFEALAGSGILIAGPHNTFPGLGRLYKAASAYRWAPVSYSNRWEER